MNRKIADWIFLGVCVAFLSFRGYQLMNQLTQSRSANLPHDRQACFTPRIEQRHKLEETKAI